MEAAGARLLLLEAVPNEASTAVVEATTVPVIGCGAGTACHGQIVVTQDLLGLTDWQPAFAQPISDLGNQLVESAMEWRRKVSAGDLGEHPYRMKDGSTPSTNVRE